MYRQKQCLKGLLTIPELAHMTNLSGESLFLSPLSLRLRSGDMIIIFALDTETLQELVTLKNEFTNFRIILILGENSHESLCLAHMLHPSFIIFSEDKLTALEAVLKKMLVSEEITNYAQGLMAS